MRRLISSGSRFEAEAGYSRAVVDGEWVFVAGTTGFDYAAMTIADDPAEQARQALRNIAAALGEAGASLADVLLEAVRSETVGAVEDLIADRAPGRQAFLGQQDAGAGDLVGRHEDAVSFIKESYCCGV